MQPLAINPKVSPIPTSMPQGHLVLFCHRALMLLYEGFHLSLISQQDIAHKDDDHKIKKLSFGILLVSGTFFRIQPASQHDSYTNGGL
jgi:hypothetical protein